MLVIVPFARFATYGTRNPRLMVAGGLLTITKKIPFSSFFLFSLLRCCHPLPYNKINITTRNFAFPGIAVNVPGLRLWFRTAE